MQTHVLDGLTLPFVNRNKPGYDGGKPLPLEAIPTGYRQMYAAITERPYSEAPIMHTENLTELRRALEDDRALIRTLIEVLALNLPVLHG